MAKPSICDKCPAKDAPGPVLPQIVQNPRLIFLAEAPGDNEVKQGKPFVGWASYALWRACEQIGLERSDVSIINTARCITKHPGAFNYCWRHFGKADLDSHNDDIPVVVMGNAAKDAIAPELTHKILTLRGTRYKTRFIFALHPSFLRRTTAAKGSTDKQDLMPTLTYDIGTALEKGSLPPMRLVSEIED